MKHALSNRARFRARGALAVILILAASVSAMPQDPASQRLTPKGVRSGSSAAAARTGLSPQATSPRATPIECNAEHDNYDDCVECCENDLTAQACNTLGALGCLLVPPKKTCTVVVALGCGPIEHWKEGFCVETSCKGKPGSPSCSDALPCSNAGGSCWQFCPSSTDSECGSCPEPGNGNPFAEECCVPR